MDAITGASSWTRTNVAGPPAGKPNTSAAESGAAKIASRPQKDSADISGRAVMISRLYKSTPESVTYTPGAAPASGSIYNFLTADDKTAIASMYEYANTNGVDPQKVDQVAFDLGIYRSEPAGVVHPMPVRYDGQGNARPAAFSDSDEATAQRLLTSKAIKDSALPEGFLRTELDPAFSEGHAADFTFLEKAVYATSKSGAGSTSDPSAAVPARPKDYFAQLQATGQVLTPEQVKGSTTAEEQPATFARYADRLGAAAAGLSDSEKQALTTLYNAAGHGTSTVRMKDVDKLARTMSALRLAGLTGHAADRTSTTGAQHARARASQTTRRTPTADFTA